MLIAAAVHQWRVRIGMTKTWSLSKKVLGHYVSFKLHDIIWKSCDAHEASLEFLVYHCFDYLPHTGLVTNDSYIITNLSYVCILRKHSNIKFKKTWLSKIMWQEQISNAENDYKNCILFLSLKCEFHYSRWVIYLYMSLFQKTTNLIACCRRWASMMLIYRLTDSNVFWGQHGKQEMLHRCHHQQQQMMRGCVTKELLLMKVSLLLVLLIWYWLR